MLLVEEFDLVVAFVPLGKLIESSLSQTGH